MTKLWDPFLLQLNELENIVNDSAYNKLKEIYHEFAFKKQEGTGRSNTWNYNIHVDNAKIGPIREHIECHLIYWTMFVKRETFINRWNIFENDEIKEFNTFVDGLNDIFDSIPNKHLQKKIVIDATAAQLSNKPILIPNGWIQISSTLFSNIMTGLIVDAVLFTGLNTPGWVWNNGYVSIPDGYVPHVSGLIYNLESDMYYHPYITTIGNQDPS